MAKTASMYLRIDPKVKAEVEAVYSHYGMTVTDAINVFLHQSINIGGLPFDLRPPKPNAETLAAMEDVNNKRNLSKTFHSVADLMEDLDAED